MIEILRRARVSSLEPKGDAEMAKKNSNRGGVELTTGEVVGGFLYLPVYLILLAVGLEFLNQLLGLGLDIQRINYLYFSINALMILLIFRKFLLRSFRNICFWELIQAAILGAVLYYVGRFVLSWVIALLQVEVTSFNDETVNEMVGRSPAIMAVFTVVAAPLVEEVLVRGVIFGTIRRKNRVAAYVISVLFFAGMHVWQYLLAEPPVEVLKTAVLYIPAGIALAWTYEKADNIWASVLLHMFTNAVTFGLVQFLT
jgi:membrane protease YdiL (CAAX protease family)